MEYLIPEVDVSSNDYNVQSNDPLPNPSTFDLPDDEVTMLKWVVLVGLWRNNGLGQGLS